MKHSEIYRGKTLTCTVQLRGKHTRWECQIEGMETIFGVVAAVGAELPPSKILAKAIAAGRTAIDRVRPL